MNIERATAICLKKFPKFVKNLENILFRKMALADPIFALDGRFQLFWTAFDMLVTVVPLKAALVWEKIIFWHLKKIITQV